MIMGAGKTTVITPLLVLMLASRRRLVTVTVPASLLSMARGCLSVLASRGLAKRTCAPSPASAVLPLAAPPAP